MTPVGAVSNRTASACPDSCSDLSESRESGDPDLSGLETASTKPGERKCLLIFKFTIVTQVAS